MENIDQSDPHNNSQQCVTLFIGGFPSKTTEGIFCLKFEDDLKEYFKDYNSFLDVSIVKNKKKNSKGFGYLKFESPEEAQYAIKTKHKIFGKMVRILNMI